MAKRRKRSRPTIPPGEKIFTLDVSSSAVGFAFGAGPELLHWGKYVMRDGDPIGLKLLNFSKWLSRTIHNLPAKPDVVVIESPYFLRNVHTFSVLSKFVAIAQREVRRILGYEAYLMNPSEVKKILKLPKARSYDQNKRNMVRHVNHVFGLNLRFFPSRGTKSKKSDDDVADAIGLWEAFCKKTGRCFEEDDSTSI